MSTTATRGNGAAWAGGAAPPQTSWWTRVIVALVVIALVASVSPAQAQEVAEPDAVALSFATQPGDAGWPRRSRGGWRSATRRIHRCRRHGERIVRSVGDAWPRGAR